jgi:hypothetical protein
VRSVLRAVARAPCVIVRVRKARRTRNAERETSTATRERASLQLRATLRAFEISRAMLARIRARTSIANVVAEFS